MFFDDRMFFVIFPESCTFYLVLVTNDREQLSPGMKDETIIIFSSPDPLQRLNDRHPRCVMVSPLSWRETSCIDHHAHPKLCSLPVHIQISASSPKGIFRGADLTAPFSSDCVLFGSSEVFLPGRGAVCDRFKVGLRDMGFWGQDTDDPKRKLP